MGYRNGYEVLGRVRDLSVEGRATFTEIMFATGINPGILARLLRRGVEAGLIDNRCGYRLTPSGDAVLGLAAKIVNA